MVWCKSNKTTKKTTNKNILLVTKQTINLVFVIFFPSLQKCSTENYTPCSRTLKIQMKAGCQRQVIITPQHYRLLMNTFQQPRQPWQDEGSTLPSASSNLNAGCSGDFKLTGAWSWCHGSLTMTQCRCISVFSLASFSHSSFRLSKTQHNLSTVQSLAYTLQKQTHTSSCKASPTNTKSSVSTTSLRKGRGNQGRQLEPAWTCPLDMDQTAGIRRFWLF